MADSAPLPDASTDPPPDGPHSEGPLSDGTPYRVLARKYRPTDFAGLVGQEALVRTLTNAIASGRLAHAFVLTGVRGVGKTTTARIIARALNCTGEDGQGGPTAAPCGVCENCLAISEDRHVDVIEMDAASRTGVDDIRDLIDGVRYRPVSARFKVYIVDEVHMLSRNAFNALLKTLEEPPEHVKFIFATTEIQKVPVTVLSRCQRFDLRRVEVETLERHFGTICEREKVQVSPAAMALICRAADGSVRDGLSLLDQSIALTGGDVCEDQVRDMLGLADRGQSFDLLEVVFKGDAGAALAQIRAMYQDGADPVAVINDLLELTHLLTRIKVAAGDLSALELPELERTRGAAMAEKLLMPSLSRAWQMLLKGVGELKVAPSPVQALEMVLIRLAYVADLPSPGEALKKLMDAPPGTASPETPPPEPAPPQAAAPHAVSPHAAPPKAAPIQSAPADGITPTDAIKNGSAPVVPGANPSAPPPPSDPGASPEPGPSPAETAAPAPARAPENLVDVISVLEAEKKVMLAAHLVTNVHLVSFEASPAGGRIEVRPTENAPRTFAADLAGVLNRATGATWTVALSEAEGQPTLQQQRDAALAADRAAAQQDPVVKAVMDAFPGAELDEVAGAEDGRG